MPPPSTADSLGARAGWQVAMVVGCGIALLFLYHWALVTDGRFWLAPPRIYGLTFNSMIERMLQGGFDVDPAVILREGFTREGRTYAYFGIVPALLRLPLVWLPDGRTMDVTALYCAAAATLAAVAKVATAVRVGRVLAATAARRLVPLLALALVLGGGQVQFLKPSVYQESAFWAAAIAACFVLLAACWCLDPAGRRRWHLAGMATLAGLCLLTRVSTSIGLYAACGGLLLLQLVDWLRPDRRWRDLASQVLLPGAILLGFAAVCGYINYERWGNPLTFQDWRYYNFAGTDDPAHDVIRLYGFFSVHRILFGLAYYVVPIWAIIRPPGHFIFHDMQDRLFVLVEGPPASMLLSDMSVCLLAGLGLLWLWRQRWAGGEAGLVAAGLALPGLLMTMAMAAAFRYRMEFYPSMEFLAFLGLPVAAAALARAPRRVIAVFVVSLAVSIVSAHLLLLAYKITPFGDLGAVESAGWVAAYRSYLFGAYPSLGRLF